MDLIWNSLKRKRIKYYVLLYTIINEMILSSVDIPISVAGITYLPLVQVKGSSVRHASAVTVVKTAFQT